MSSRSPFLDVCEGVGQGEGHRRQGHNHMPGRGGAPGLCTFAPPPSLHCTLRVHPIRSPSADLRRERRHVVDQAEARLSRDGAHMNLWRMNPAPPPTHTLLRHRRTGAEGAGGNLLIGRRIGRKCGPISESEGGGGVQRGCVGPPRVVVLDAVADPFQKSTA